MSHTRACRSLDIIGAGRKAVGYSGVAIRIHVLKFPFREY